MTTPTRIDLVCEITALSREKRRLELIVDYMKPFVPTDEYDTILWNSDHQADDEFAEREQQDYRARLAARPSGANRPP